MKKYIDCELACAEVDKGDLLTGNNAEWAKEIINRTPAADVVEVVRCRDCKYSKFIKNYSKYMCDKRGEGHGELKYSNDFCSDGEKK